MRKNIFSDKKGNVQINILVIGVVLICGLVLFSLNFHNEKVKRDILEGVQAVEEMRFRIDTLKLYEDMPLAIGERSNLESFFGVERDSLERKFFKMGEGKKYSIVYFLP